MVKPGTSLPPDRAKLLVLAPTLLAVLFLYAYALQYLSTDPERLGIFWVHRSWLHVHVGGGMFALLTGPIQLWIERDRQHPVIHRILAIGYMTSVIASAIAALYLAFHTGFGWVFGMGFSAMALAWLMSTSLAAIAIWRRRMPQYREWMLRSYVVTFGFVTYEILLETFKLTDTGTIVEQMTAASWACWSVPLLITETVLQGRKVFSKTATVEVGLDFFENRPSILPHHKNDAA